VKFESGNPSGFPDSYFLKDSKAVSAAEDQSVDETQVLDANDFEKLERRAKNMLLHQLSRSIKSTKQLRDYLTKREIPSPVIDAAIERFTEAGLIDDLRYAETFAASKRSTRGLSTSALRRELGAKGIPTALIDEVLAQYSQEDDLKTAIRLAEKRIRGMGHLEREVRHRRLLGFLGRKGFSSSICFNAIKAAEQSLNQ
jgi:regulatory protein